MKSLVRSTAQPSPAEIGSPASVSSWPYRGMPASIRSVSRAPSPAGRTVAPSWSLLPISFMAMAAILAGRISSTPSSPVYPLRKTVNLISMKLDCSNEYRFMFRTSTGRISASRSITFGPWMATMAVASVVSVSSMSNPPVWRTASKWASSFSRLLALQITIQLLSALDTITSSSTPPASLHTSAYRHWPTFCVATLRVTTLSRNRCASGPANVSRPMCDTSNRLPLRRVCSCSSTIPRYSSGISHPAKSTSLAPAEAWKSWNGVRLSIVGGPYRPPPG